MKLRTNLALAGFALLLLGGCSASPQEVERNALESGAYPAAPEVDAPSPLAYQAEFLDEWTQLKSIPPNVDQLRASSVGFLALTRGEDGPGVLSYSPDALTWTDVDVVSITGESERPRVAEIYARSTSFLLSFNGDMWETEDGISWDRTFSAANENHSPTVYGSGEQLIAIQAGFGSTTLATSFSTGVWHDDEPSYMARRIEVNDAAFSDDAVVIVGARVSPTRPTEDPDALRAGVGGGLEDVNLPASMDAEIMQVEWDATSERFIAIASSYREETEIYTSETGVHWSGPIRLNSSRGLPSWMDHAVVNNMLVSTPNGVVAVAHTDDGPGHWLSSDGGSTWSYAPLFADPQPGAIDLRMVVPGECLLRAGSSYFYGPCAEPLP